MMSIARLLDKDIMRGKNNCALSRLIKTIHEAGDVALACIPTVPELANKSA